MKIELPELKYPLSGLSPTLSQETLEFHHGKHHQAYVNNLNKLIAGTSLEKATLEEIIMNSDGSIFNNAAQIWNHTFYFEAFSPKGKREPSGHIGEAIEESFGSFQNFKEEFSKSAATLFGSGWAWLAADSSGRLSVYQEPNAGNPLTKGLKPLLTCDVWEHAYYIDYRNNRANYIESFWKIVDWDIVGKRM